MWLMKVYFFRDSKNLCPNILIFYFRKAFPIFRRYILVMKKYNFIFIDAFSVNANSITKIEIV